jgi:DNA-binding response OmpR family regulator
MSPLILIVEDEPAIAEVVGLYLRRAGFQSHVAADGLAALDFIASNRPPDLVVLDLMLPKLDGYEVLRRIRRSRDVPVIMLTARKSEADRIAGLEMGADDYVVKPFSAQELVSRVRAVLRRAKQTPEHDLDAPLEYDGLSIDPVARVVKVRGAEKSLTAKEFDLLVTLARRPRTVLNRDRLLELVWGSADYIDPSTVTVHVRRVRAKIEDDPSAPRFIKTVWGVGYRFEP